MGAQCDDDRFMIELERRQSESTIVMEKISNTFISIEDMERRARERARREMHARRLKLIKELFLVEALIKTLDSEI